MRGQSPYFAGRLRSLPVREYVELVELVAYGEITGEERIIDGMLRRIKPEAYELVVMYRINDLPCSVFLFVSEPCMLIGVLTEDILRIEQGQQL